MINNVSTSIDDCRLQKKDETCTYQVKIEWGGSGIAMKQIRNEIKYMMIQALSPGNNTITYTLPHKILQQKDTHIYII